MFSFTFPPNSESKPERLAVKLTSQGELSVLQKHPWIFSDSIVKINKEGKSGDLAIIFSKNKNKMIGIGLYDPDSPIRIKMIYHGHRVNIDAEFFDEKIKNAFSIRQDLLKTETNSYRLVFGENDGFPGLIADVYAQVLVIKLYSKIWLPYFEDIVNSLLRVSQCKTVVLRLSRNLQSMASMGISDGDVIFGELENETVHFLEHGVHFSANVIKGHKTGYFLDHRHNRKKVGELSTDKRVLDVFAYAGGFSVHALVNGAKEVTSLDISAHALELAKENAYLNEFSGKHQIRVGDAFDALKNLIAEGQTYDVVVIDPPSFAKKHSEIHLAKKKYRQLAQLGLQITAKNGILVLASCSSRVLQEDFFGINKDVLNRSERPYKLLFKTEHDSDHPIGFKEGAYLKCGYYQFIDD